MYILGAVSTAIVMLSELFLGRKGYFSRRNGEDKEVEIEYCEVWMRTSSSSSTGHCRTRTARW